MNICEKATDLFNKTYGNYLTATGIESNGKKIKLRLFKKGDMICYFRKNSCKYGYHLEDCHLADILPITHYKTEAQKWESGWKKVKGKLEVSGLWKEVIEEINVALAIGYDKMQTASKKYWEIKNEKEKTEFFKTIDARLIGKNEKGEEYIKSSLVWNYAKLPKVEKMRFYKNKERNEVMLSMIKKYMDEKKTLHLNGRTDYDISFEYAPEKGNKAWYSKEFKGCGNGHYYLVLDATHTIFVEDD